MMSGFLFSFVSFFFELRIEFKASTMLTKLSTTHSQHLAIFLSLEFLFSLDKVSLCSQFSLGLHPSASVSQLAGIIDQTPRPT